MSDYIKNKTDEELERDLQWANETLPKFEAKLHIYGKMLGETSVETIVRMIECMYDDCSSYKYYKSSYNDTYDELERRKQDNAEGD